MVGFRGFLCVIFANQGKHILRNTRVQSDSTRKKETDEIQQSQMSKCKHSFKGSEFDRNCILKQ